MRLPLRWPEKGSLRRSGRHAGLVVVALGALVFFAAAAGLIPIAASSGHWPITAWFLHFTMRQSVQTRTLGNASAPALDRPVVWVKGAKHFAARCASCHGAPGRAPDGIFQHMTPHPPDLSTRIGKWEPDELFWIVKHGVKFTGMPAWPALDRDDEVWAMVGFLVRLPRMTPVEYERVTDPPPSGASLPGPLNGAVRELLDDCVRCHGADGSGGASGAFPRLANQSRAYLEASLEAYAEARRHSGIMQPAAAALNPEQRRQIALYYAQASAPLPSSPTLPGSAEEGKRLARRGVPEKGIPSCVHCHGPASVPRNPFYPKLAGQHAAYLVLQMELFKKGQRGGTPFAPIMHENVDRITASQIRDLASYYAALRPETGAAPDQKARLGGSGAVE